MARQLEAQAAGGRAACALRYPGPTGDEEPTAASRAAVIAEFAHDHGVDLSRDLRVGMEADEALDYDVHVVPGRHANMVRDPHAEALARQLTACIEVLP